MKEVDSETAFAFWLKTAKPGERVLYYDGFLMRDREAFLRAGGTVDNFPAKIKAAIHAWRAYLDGAVKLVQKKREDYEYEYIAIKV